MHVELGGLRAGAGVLLPLPRRRPALAGRPHPHRAGRRRATGPADDVLHLVRAVRARLLHRLPPARRGGTRPRRCTSATTSTRTRAGAYARPAAASASTPAPEAVTLADYRLRYAQYKTDADLQAAHAAAPWLVVWDDHEVENNWAGDVREPAREPARAVPAAPGRRVPGVLGEHAAARGAAPARPDMQLYRRVAVGPAGDVPHARHPPVPRRPAVRRRAATARTAPTRPARCPARRRSGGSPTASAESRARWDVLGQQVFFAQLDLTPGAGRRLQHGHLGRLPGLPRPGRRRLGRRRGVRNPVVLTGDVHAHWAADIKPRATTRRRRSSAPSW